MEYGETVYVNQGKMELLEEEIAEFVASKYGFSSKAGSKVIEMLFMDRIREDEYTPEDIPLFEELKRVQLIW